MAIMTKHFNFLPCVDSEELGESNRKTLMIARDLAVKRGQAAIDVTNNGIYVGDSGVIDIKESILAAQKNKVSISPSDLLPTVQIAEPFITDIEVRNETSLNAAIRLKGKECRPLILNFANGNHPGGGFLTGSLAQEEALCRASALYSTLVGDPMYEFHSKRPVPDSTDWAIYSPDVPFFLNDNGSPMIEPLLFSVLTCAAPVAHAVGIQKSAALLKQRIGRVLSIAEAYGHTGLVLGAWGCGAFGNNVRQTAIDFKDVLENSFSGVFDQVVFAIADWSPERKFLNPFREVFSA